MARIDRKALVTRARALAEAATYDRMLLTRAEVRSLLLSPEVLQSYVGLRNDADVVGPDGKPTGQCVRTAICKSFCIPKRQLADAVSGMLSDRAEGMGARLSVTLSLVGYPEKHRNRLVVWLS